jgi:regulator of replication initiation timing
LRAALGGDKSDQAKKLSTDVHHLAVQNQLINLENDGLRETLDTQKQRRNQKKVLDVQQRKEYWVGAIFYSPRKIREAQFRDVIKARDKDAEELRKVTAKELRESNSLLKKKLAEEKAEKAAKLKADRAQMKAEKEADRDSKQRAKNTTAALKTAQTGKRKALRASHPNAKRQRLGGGAAESVASSPAPVAAPPKVNSRGRTINVPSKYR